MATMAATQDGPGRVLVVGGGLAGLACARTLAEAGASVTVLDKGRRPGGRCATRRDAAGVRFDHGAQYVTARDPAFREFLLAAEAAGAAAAWDIPGRTGDPAYVGLPGMRALAERLAHPRVTVRRLAHAGFLHRGAEGWRARVFAAESVAPGTVAAEGGTLTEAYDAAVLAIPAAQAAPLLAAMGHAFAQPMATITHAPCLALMLTFDQPVAGPDVIRPEAGPDARPEAGPDAGPFGWLARQSGRPGAARLPEAWVAHATAAASAALLDDPGAEAALIGAFRAWTGAGPPATAALHRWRYAQVTRALGQPFLWDGDAQMGVCGDGLLAARAEAAFVSGVALARAICPRVVP